MKKAVIIFGILFLLLAATASSQVANKVMLTDKYGRIVDIHQDSDGGWHIGSSISQVVHVVSENSSTTNLASSATFTGVSHPTTNVNAIQVSLKTDVNAVVVIQQSPDGTNWDIADSYNYYYMTNNFGVTVQAVNSYFRVLVTNTSTTSSSYFRLQSVLCPIAAAEPRSLNENGHLKTSIYGNEDTYGFEAENTPNGETRAITPVLIVGRSFEGSVFDPNFWTTYLASGGTLTQANGIVTLSTNTTNGAARFSSVRRARYIPGQSHVFRTHVALTSAGQTSNIRQWGVAFSSAGTPTVVSDGALYSMTGTTFSVVTVKSGAATTVYSGAFNGPLGATWAPVLNSIHTYEIYWNNRKAVFTVDGKALHEVDSSAAVWSDTMQFHIYMGNDNSGGLAANHVLTSSVAGIRRLGSRLSQPSSKYVNGSVPGTILKYGPGNAHGISIGGITDTAVVSLYDSITAGTGTIFSTGTMAIKATSNNLPFFIDLKGLPFFSGLVVSITTATCNATVTYE